MKALRSICGPVLLVTLIACAPAAEEPAEVAAEPEAQAPQEQATASVFIVNEVADFDAWKVVFDEHEAARSEAGIVWHSVSRGLENENNVFFHAVASDLARLQEFVTSEDLKEKMEEAGVTGPPEIVLATDVEILRPEPPVEGDLFSVFIQHRVADFDAWKTAYDADAPRRAEAGWIATSVSRDAGDPNMVIIHGTSNDLEKLTAMLASEELKTVMAEAGVEGEPVIRLAKDVESKTFE